jgi:thioredoxin reductase/Fe-S-cluster-containing hydrogenase component 2
MLNTEIAIVGAGPAGLAAGLAAREAGADVLVLDDQAAPGGQLFKQIHKFFGSREHMAGTRGFKIGRQMLDQAEGAGVPILLGAQVMGIFEDQVLGVVRDRKTERLHYQKVILATGAEENRLAFPGWTLSGVMTAGAAQTLINIHHVLPGRRVLMVGAGNVGLIVGYQLLQAGAEVVAVVEAVPTIGGYWVHASKLRRAGVPIMTRHTILEARGDGQVEEALIAEVDEQWQPRPGTERTLDVDTICLAVGLAPSTRLTTMAGCQHRWEPARGGHVPVHDERFETTVPGLFVAGDLAGVEEATTAMEQGRIAGYAAAHALGYLSDQEFEARQAEGRRRLESLKQPPRVEGSQVAETGVLSLEDIVQLPGVPPLDRMVQGAVAVMECAQEIPCNPCVTNCPQGAVRMGDTLTRLPELDPDECSGCGLCVADCPGQAVFLVDLAFAPDQVTVTFPYEFLPLPKRGDLVQGTDREGRPVTDARVEKVVMPKKYEHTAVVTISIPREFASIVRGIDWRALRQRER